MNCSAHTDCLIRSLLTPDAETQECCNLGVYVGAALLPERVACVADAWVKEVTTM